VDSNDILTSLNDGIYTITLNRPDVRNALTMSMWRELLNLLRDAAMNPDVRVVVLTGAGNGFCSGADVRSMGTVDEKDPLAVQFADNPVWMDTELRVERMLRNTGISELLHTMGKPTIAAVRGAAAGAGFSFAAACDFRIASESASFSAAFAKLGTSGDYGITYFLSNIVGPTSARELLFLGDKLDAKRALQIGLVSRVVPDSELENEVDGLAARLSRSAPVAIRLMKQNLVLAEAAKLREVLELEARNMIRSLQTEDSQEAVRAFKEKRPPEFQGR